MSRGCHELLRFLGGARSPSALCDSEEHAKHKRHSVPFNAPEGRAESFLEQTHATIEGYNAAIAHNHRRIAELSKPSAATPPSREFLRL